MTDEQTNNPDGHEFGKEAEEYISKLPCLLQQVAWNAFLTGASIGAKKYKNIAAAHSRDEEIKQLEFDKYLHTKRIKTQEEIIAELRNPWITDRDPEIKGSISDAVLLLVDWLFYRVSRLERRKDGSEFWWGVDVANGEEVTAWMPIPKLKGDEV